MCIYAHCTFCVAIIEKNTRERVFFESLDESKEGCAMKKNQRPGTEADSLTENYKFINHRKCEFFPCHETSDEDGFNCLFCYCPLYALGRKMRRRLRVSRQRHQGLQQVPQASQERFLRLRDVASGRGYRYDCSGRTSQPVRL